MIGRRKCVALALFETDCRLLLSGDCRRTSLDCAFFFQTNYESGEMNWTLMSHLKCLCFRLTDNCGGPSPNSQSDSTCGSPVGASNGGHGSTDASNAVQSANSANQQSGASSSSLITSRTSLTSSTTPTYSSTAAWTLSASSDNALGTLQTCGRRSRDCEL